MQINFRYIWINNFSQVISVKPHSHNCCEIIFYEKADGYSNLYGVTPYNQTPKADDIVYSSSNTQKASKKLDFKDSTVVFFKKGQSHDEIHTKPAKLVALGFEINDVLPFELDSFAVKDDGAIKNLINHIVQEHENESILYKNAIENYISLIIIETLRLSNQSIDHHSPIFNAISYLSNYFFTEIDFDNLAKISGYSLGHFRHLFKKKLGISPKRFVLNKRYEYALKLLKDDSLSLQEVGSLCGYDDYPQFSTFFKSIAGISPIQYKEKHNRETSS